MLFEMITNYFISFEWKLFQQKKNFVFSSLLANKIAEMKI